MLAKENSESKRIHFWILAFLLMANLSLALISYSYFKSNQAAIPKPDKQESLLNNGMRMLKGAFSISDYLKHFNSRR